MEQKGWFEQVQKLSKIQDVYSVNEMAEQIENQLLNPFMLSIHKFISA